MVAIIGSGTASLCRYLEEQKLTAAGLDGERVPSLTGLLLEKPEISDIVLTGGAEKNWSMGHILAAAKQLQSRGRLVLMGAGGQLPALLCAAEDKEALLALLQKPVKPGSSGSAGGKGPRFSQKGFSGMPEPPKMEIRSLSIPPGKMLFLGVVGSQRRIGCTTQAVGLWHYCKALGFDPAVVMGQEPLARLAAPMDGQEIPGGYRIEGVPFVADTAQRYDCYILDIGVGDIREARKLVDCLVLVVGGKPWELPDTAAALRAAGHGDLVVLLSFSSREDGQALAPLFGRRAVAVLPWMPRLWQPSPAAMAIYDKLLRPAMERALAREELLPEEAPEDDEKEKGDV